VTIALDTNVLVRYLTWDDAKQASAAATIIDADETISISTLVLCELAWVLRHAYHYTDADLDSAISGIIESRNVMCDREAAEMGLAMLRKGGDFADGVVENDAMRAKCRHIVTFDRQFARLLGSDRAILLR
jgi:predicted nucleic-acid-binding protein